MVPPSETMAIRRTGPGVSPADINAPGICQISLFYLQKEKTWPRGAIMDLSRKINGDLYCVYELPQP